MTTRDHLVYQLQAHYSCGRDLLPWLDLLHHRAGHEQPREMLAQVHAVLRSQLELLERALNLLGARYKQEHNPFPPAEHEATERFQHRMAPSQEQVEIYALLEVTHWLHWFNGAFQGEVDLAREIGEADVARLLTEGSEQLHAILEPLAVVRGATIRGVARTETRRAA
jgi:hypothetical protein